MTNLVAARTRQVTVVGGSFGYGTYTVTGPGGVVLGEYPAHFVLNTDGDPIDAATEETLVAASGKLDTLATKLDTLASAIAAQTQAVLGQSVILTDAFGNPVGGVTLDAGSA